jgi:hypothetical protein
MPRQLWRILWVAAFVGVTDKLFWFGKYPTPSSLVAMALSTRSPQQNNSNDYMNRREASAFVVVNAFGAGLTVYPPETLGDSTTTTPSSPLSPIVQLSDGSKFPLASFGLQIYDDNTAYKLTLMALECGYRNFFASVLAGNQKGFAKAIRDSNIPRNELYICGSVVSNRVAGLEAAQKETTKGWKRNMEAFAFGNIDYLDQIMLDYPGKQFGNTGK